MSKPKALMLASVASMIEQFNMNNIDMLLELGYDVDVVCNCLVGNTISDERVKLLVEKLKSKGVMVLDTPFPRKISDFKGIINSYKQVKKLFDDNNYQLMHCHSPIGSVIARLAARNARNNGTRIVYTAHGFHFYKGAPLINWLIFYPIEKLCSYYTDVLITINKEDYEFAKKHMSAKRVEYVPGIGIDVNKFKLNNFDREGKRKQLDISYEDIMLLSVGELNKNKNHEVVIRAIAKSGLENIHYVIAGQGDRYEYLNKLAKGLGVNLDLLGYRTDVVELLNAADIFVFPSYREGLSVALMEAMAAELPVICSDIRGNNDLIVQGEGGFLCNPHEDSCFSKGLKVMQNENRRMYMGKYNLDKMANFDKVFVLKIIKNIYISVI